MDETVRAAWEEAERGDPEAQIAVGMMYLTGRGVEADADEAVIWLRRAADQDDLNAQYNLGIMYDTGFHGMLPQDPLEALRWFRRAARQGHDGAQYNIGVAYAEGKGVAQDAAQAIQWWLKAAEVGNARAQYNLGVSYSKGEGVDRDDVQAVAWWRKAALPPDPTIEPQHLWLLHEERAPIQGAGDSGRGEHGYANAQYHLGRMYALGQGVASDTTRALEWLRRAAAQGHGAARATLAQRFWKRILLLGGVTLFAMAILTVLVAAN